MQELRHYGVEAFLNRFYNFCDAAVRSVEVRANARDGLSAEASKDLWIVLRAKDQLGQPKDAPVEVTLAVEGIIELSEGATTDGPLQGTLQGTLQDGLSMGFIGEQLFLALDAEAYTPQQYRRAEFYAIGQRCFWSVARHKG